MHADVAAGAARTGAHSNQAESAAGGWRERRSNRGRHPDCQSDVPAVAGEFHLYVLCPGMSRNIC
jgi:hypothetical protein